MIWVLFVLAEATWTVIEETLGIIWVKCEKNHFYLFEHQRKSVRCWQFFETCGRNQLLLSLLFIAFI